MEAGTAETINDNDNNNDTTVSTAMVSDCRYIYELTVDVDIQHSWRSDLRVSLIDPTRITAVLHNRTGFWDADLVGSYGTSGGSLNPDEDLSVFLDSTGTGTGTWTLSVEDHAAGDSGQLDAWSLSLTCY